MPRPQKERIMKDIKIAVLPGDGIGPEIVAQAVKAVDAVIQQGLTIKQK